MLLADERPDHSVQDPTPDRPERLESLLLVGPDEDAVEGRRRQVQRVAFQASFKGLVLQGPEAGTLLVLPLQELDVGRGLHGRLTGLLESRRW